MTSETTTTRVYRLAKSSDPELQALYVTRRKMATKATGSGISAMRAWAQLEATEAKLRRLDPEGEWRYEGRDYGARKWHLELPA